MSGLKAIGAGLLFFFAVQATGVPPPNDNFENAASFAGLVVEGTTGEATRQPGEPYNSHGVRSVWFKWTPLTGDPPDTSVPVRIVLEEGEASVWILSASGDTFSDLAIIGENGSTVKLANRRNYYFAVFSPIDGGGQFRFRIEPELRPKSAAPQNDNFRDAAYLVWKDAKAICAGSTSAATVEIGEPGGVADGSVWFWFVPEFSGTLKAELQTGRAEFSTFAGKSLTELVPAGPMLTRGERYYVRVTGQAELPPPFSFRLSIEPSPDERPSNDDFLSAALLPTGTNVIEGDWRATSEAGEPAMMEHGVIAAKNTRWWKFQAARNGYMLTFTKAGDSVSGTYAIYSGGPEMGELIRIPLPGPSYESIMYGRYTPLEAGKTYYLQVQLGTLTVRIHEGGLINDSFADAYMLQSDLEPPEGRSLIELIGHTHGATSEPGEPNIQGGIGSTVWYTWVTPYEGLASFQAGQGLFQSAIYRGESVNSLTKVSDFSFWVDKGERYYFQVDALQSEGPFYGRLEIASNRATNDSFNQATWMDDSYVFAKHATLEPGEPPHRPGPSKSLWWKWESPLSGMVGAIAHTATDATVAIYEGEDLESLRLLNKGEVTARARVRGGETYRIAVAVPTNNIELIHVWYDFSPEIETNEISGNLIQNGSFESGLAGWVIGGGASSTVTGRPPQGTSYLGMPSAPASVSQRVMVQPGVEHELRFAFVPQEWLKPFAEIRVHWDDNLLASIESNDAGNWHWATFRFVPHHPAVTLTFDNLHDASAIDAISVVPMSTPPKIVGDLADLRIAHGEDVFFRVRVEGSEPLTYQWHKDGSRMAGEKSAWLKLPAVSRLSAGTYHVVVSNAHGRVESRQALLDVAEFSSLAILVHPISGAGYQSNYFALSVTAAGPGPISFQWMKNGTPIDGANGPDLVFSSLSSGDAGSYAVRIQSGGVTLLSRAATVSVLANVADPSGGMTLSYSTYGRVYDVDGTTPVGSNYIAQVFFGTEPGNMRTHWPPSTLDPFLGFADPPAWQGLHVPNLPAQGHGLVQVRVWERSKGASFEHAKLAGGKVVESAVVPLEHQQSGGQRHNISRLPVVYLSAGLPSFDLPASPGLQRIEFPPIGNARYGSGAIPLAATASSGLPVRFEVAYGPATVAGTSLLAHGVGEVGVRAVQEGNGTFWRAEMLQTVTVVRGIEPILFEVQRRADSSVELGARTPSGLPVHFQIVDGSATLEGNIVRNIAPEGVVMRAAHDGNSEFERGSADRVILPTLLEQAISFPDIPDIIQGASAGAGLARQAVRPAVVELSLEATASSGLPVAFELVGGPAVLKENLLTVTNDGQVSVRAVQTGDFIFAPARAEQTFSADLWNKAAQSIQFEPVGELLVGAPAVQLAAVASSGLAVSFELLSGPAELQGSVLVVTGAGRVVVRAWQAGNDAYESAIAEQTIIVEKRVQSIEFREIPAMRPGTTIALEATASSGLPVEFELVSGAAELSGNLLRATQTGAVSVRAIQAGNDIFNRTVVERTILVRRESQSITFTPVPAITFGSSVLLKATASSGLPIVFQVVSGPGQISGDSLLPFAPGTLVLRAFQGGNEVFEAATAEQTVAVNKKTQSVQIEDPGALRIDSPVQLRATATSRLPVTFELISGPAQLAGDMLTAVGRGAIVVRASQSGSAMYDAASAERTIVAGKEAQTIEFPPIAEIRFGDRVVLQAAASSGLPVRFVVVSGPGRLEGIGLTATNVGQIEILAAQDGSDDFDAAPNVTRTVLAKKAFQTISFNLPVAVLLSDLPYSLGATASSGLPVNFSIVSGTGRIEENLFNSDTAGKSMISATQSGDDLFESAVAVERVLEVLPVPKLGIALEGTSLFLSWPSSHTEARVENAPAVEGPWTVLDGNPESSGGRITQAIRLPQTNAFYRLKLK